MSRRLPTHHQRRTPPDNNPYQGTTIVIPANGYLYHHSRCGRNGGLKPSTTIDIGFSDETTDTYYDYCDQNGFQHSPLRESRNTDVTFSDDSGSTRLPYFEFDDESNRRYSRNTYSERSFQKPRHSPNEKFNKDVRKVYPNQDIQWDRLYHEIQNTCETVPAPSNLPRRVIVSRLSDRPQSSMSSGVTSAVVYGCGGKCQTFENVCYFFLQLVFTMGILIGVSLCIAGLVLRKSAAKNLQVLVYIGLLLALVSALLLGIQCNARSTARKRRNAIQVTKRAPIQMETLHLRDDIVQHQHQQQQQQQQQQHQFHQQLSKIRESERKMQMPSIHSMPSRSLPHRPCNRGETHPPSVIEEPGIPWWRRKDLSPR